MTNDDALGGGDQLMGRSPEEMVLFDEISTVIARYPGRTVEFRELFLSYLALGILQAEDPHKHFEALGEFLARYLPGGSEHSVLDEVNN